MRIRAVIGAAALVAALAAPGAQASADRGRSIGTPEQIAWVRHAAERFIGAELTRDGGEACAVLNAPMRAVVRGTNCEQRWNVRIRRLLRRRGERAALRRELRAAPHARVVVRGSTATISLPEALIRGQNRFRWSENCWMLES